MSRFVNGMEHVDGVLTIALIGGMGSGKSYVSSLFAKEGCAVISLDVIGHDVLTYPEVISQLTKAFGPDIVGEDGAVVRARLAAAAFKDVASTQQLNAITHPAIFSEAYARIEATRGTFRAALVEVTSGEMTREALAWADVVVAVMAPESLRTERAVERGQDRADVLRRMAQQPADAEFAAAADFCINNADDTRSPAPEVHTLCQRIFNAFDSHTFA